MRLLSIVISGLLLSFSAFAQPAPQQTASTQPPTPEHRAAEHRRVTWQQRFAQANVSHDGHLTEAQAKAGYATVAQHFQDIDTGHKGYVTEDDIRAWHQLHHATHHPAAGKPAAELHPRPALHQTIVDPPRTSVPTAMAPRNPPEASPGAAAGTGGSQTATPGA